MILLSNTDQSSFLKMVQFIKDNGKILIDTVMVFRFGLMAPSMKGIGRITKLMAWASSGMQMVTFSMANGKKIKLTVMVFTHM